MLLIISLLFSCTKQINIKTALDQDNCFASLEAKLKERNCERLAYMTTDGRDTMIRCIKPDHERTDIWDTYVFRLSYAELPIPLGAEDFVSKHTICKDSKWRIEAYPPVIN